MNTKFFTFKDLIKKDRAESSCLFLFEEDISNEKLNFLPVEFYPVIKKIFQSKKFKAKNKEIFCTLINDDILPDNLILAGLGKKEKNNADNLRNIIGEISNYLPKISINSCAFYWDYNFNWGVNLNDQILIIIESFLLGKYRFDKYLHPAKDEEPPGFVKEIYLKTGNDANYNESILKAEIISNSVYRARDLGNEPANVINPATLSQQALEWGNKFGFSVKIYDINDLKQMGMGGIISVGQGSDTPPALIEMKYRGENNKSPVVIIGKGITFDSGGISLKPPEGMGDMKMDMSGSAVVLAVMTALRDLKIKNDVIGLIPTAENMPSSKAYRPGDIITMHNKKTVEIVSTDAEGRMLLADALSYSRSFNPSFVIDLATLTGACIVALGPEYAGIMSNNDELRHKIEESAKAVGEKIWHLPLPEEYNKLIKSDVADIKNSGGRWGGALTAGLFLKFFIEDTPWAHIDIAGPSMNSERQGYIPKGATGFGTRTIINFLTNL